MHTAEYDLQYDKTSLSYAYCFCYYPNKIASTFNCLR